jgi:outer membrane protein
MRSRRTVRPGALFAPAAALCAVAAALAALPASAQQVPAVLTLSDALIIAREHSPIYQRSANDVHIASSAVRSAWAGFLPAVSTRLNFSGSQSTAITGQDSIGRPIQLVESLSFRSSSASQSVSTEVTLFDGGGTLRTLQAQRALYEGTAAQVEAAAAQLDAQVARAFYQAVKATRDIALEEQLLASAQERLARTEQLLRIAASNRVDVLGAREDVITYEQNLARVRAEADKARLTLTTVIGIEPQRAMSLDTILPPVFDPANLDVEGLVARALTTSPTVRQREAAVRAARSRRSAAVARRWPAITASASYGRSMSLSSYRAFGELNPQNTGFTFGMGASLPLFNRFQTTNAIDEAAGAEHDAEHDLRAARLTAESDIRSGVIDLGNAHHALELATERVELSRERLELALERYQLGGYSFTELQQVIDRTAQAERQALDARFAFFLAVVNLEEKLGDRLEN